jgi:imidazoleglycerol phosphate dehydratase HisB
MNDLMQDEYLSRCVVDPVKRTVYLYSSEGSEKQVTCETVEEFMNVLDFVRATVDAETLSYANPL